MTAAEQFQIFGASAEASEGVVILQAGAGMVALEPRQAQRFALCLAGAYFEAGNGGAGVNGQPALPREGTP